MKDQEHKFLFGSHVSIEFQMLSNQVIQCIYLLSKFKHTEYMYIQRKRGSNTSQTHKQVGQNKNRKEASTIYSDSIYYITVEIKYLYFLSNTYATASQNCKEKYVLWIVNHILASNKIYCQFTNDCILGLKQVLSLT